jgi:hypothetical protein
MLSFEWRELETLAERLHLLCHRHDAAQRAGNTGLVAGLKKELAWARRQRELLIRHISTRLGVVAADGGSAERSEPT